MTITTTAPYRPPRSPPQRRAYTNTSFTARPESPYSYILKHTRARPNSKSQTHVHVHSSLPSSRLGLLRNQQLPRGKLKIVLETNRSKKKGENNQNKTSTPYKFRVPKLLALWRSTKSIVTTKKTLALIFHFLPSVSPSSPLKK